MGHRFFFKEGKPDAEDPGALAAAVAEGLHAEDEEGEDLGVPSDGARRTLADDFNRWAAFSNRWRCVAEPGLDVPPVPGERNRQQTRDVARLTRGVHSRFRQTPYVLLIEDDFVLCDAALPKILGLLSPTAGIELDWSAIRLSYGLCGIVFQRKDLLAFADYIVDRQFYRPVDILAYYWFARESSQRQEAAIAHFGAVTRNEHFWGLAALVR